MKQYVVSLLENIESVKIANVFSSSLELQSIYDIICLNPKKFLFELYPDIEINNISEVKIDSHIIHVNFTTSTTMIDYSVNIYELDIDDLDIILKKIHL